LDPDAKRNSGAILVYHNKGLLSQFGHKWACGGELRTEYVSTARLNEGLHQH
jgi:hypothetical protein